MSDLLGPLLGMSPLWEALGSQAALPANNATLAAQAIRSDLGYSCLNALAPPLPERGIHWTRTGGKSWRVVIVR